MLLEYIRNRRLIGRYEMSPISVVVGFTLITAILAIVVGFLMLEQPPKARPAPKVIPRHSEDDLKDNIFKFVDQHDTIKGIQDNIKGIKGSPPQTDTKGLEADHPGIPDTIHSKKEKKLSLPQDKKESVIPNNVPPCNKSEQCFNTFYKIRQGMKFTARPCEDIYDFVCGKYPFRHNLFEEISEEIIHSLNRLIKKVTNNDYSHEQKVREYFDLCYDEKAVKNSKTELITTLNEITSWPILNPNTKWNRTTFNAIHILSELKKRGFEYNYLFNVLFEKDLEKKDKFMLTLNSPTLGISNMIFRSGRNSYSLQRYKKFIEEVFKAFGVKNPENDVQRIVNFESKLAEIILFDDTKGYDHYFKMNITGLQYNFPMIDWLTYLNSILHPDVVLSLSENVYVSDSYYYKYLTEMANNHEIESRDIANYILWRVIKDNLPYMDKSVGKLIPQYDDIIENMGFHTNRGRACILFVSTQMNLAVSAMYVRNSFNKDFLNPVKNTVKNIRQSFKRVIREVPWMDESTKIEAIRKIANIEMNIGYPQELLNKSNLDEFYANFMIDKTSFFKTTLNFKRFTKRKITKRFREPFSTNDWRDKYGDVLSMNAYYHPQNAIYIPSSIMHSNLFDMEYPNFINYARLGQIVGHEMMHSLDNKNRIFNSQGSLDNDWWSDDSSDKYLKKLHCIIDQYNNFPVEITVPSDDSQTTPETFKSSIDGNATLNENFADIGGTKIAYHAYSTWLEKNGGKEICHQTDRLKQFTYRQMFWISYVSMLCDPARSLEELITMLTSHIHPPNNYRVLGTLTNLPEFARDFNCRPNDLIFKREKCDMWA